MGQAPLRAADPNPNDHHNPNDHQNGMMREWPLLVTGFCFAAAGLGLQANQTFETLPLSFHCFSMALQLSVVALMVSIYIRRRHPEAALVMEYLAIFFGATTFMVSIATKLLTPVMLVSVVVYLISILLIIFVNLS